MSPPLDPTGPLSLPPREPASHVECRAFVLSTAELSTL